MDVPICQDAKLFTPMEIPVNTVVRLTRIQTFLLVASSELQLHENDVGCLFTGVKDEGAHVGSLWSETDERDQISVDTQTPLEHVRFMESFESRHSNREITHNLVPLHSFISA